MASCCNGATVGIVLSTTAVVVGGLGVFSQVWWRDGTGNTYSLFTVVNCTEDICALAPTDQESRILVSQVSGLSGFSLLLCSLLLQFLYRCYEKTHILYVTVKLLCFSCLMSLLHTFVTVNMYHRLTEAYMRKMWSPHRHQFLYQTLPVGLVAISGSLCVPACISLIVHRIKQTYDYKTDPKNPNRII